MVNGQRTTDNGEATLTTDNRQRSTEETTPVNGLRKALFSDIASVAEGACQFTGLKSYRSFRWLKLLTRISVGVYQMNKDIESAEVECETAEKSDFKCFFIFFSAHFEELCFDFPSLASN